MVTEIDLVSSFMISVSTDGGEVHKEIINFLLLEADGLIHALVSLYENLVRKLSFHYLG